MITYVIENVKLITLNYLNRERAECTYSRQAYHSGICLHSRYSNSYTTIVDKTSFSVFLFYVIFLHKSSSQLA